MKRLFSNFFALLALACVGFLMAACAATGQTKPVTPEDDLRYGQATLNGIYATLASSAGTAITGPQARSIYVKLEPVDATLKDADVLCRTTPNCALPTTIQGKVTAALAVLLDISNRLRSQLPASATSKLVAPR